MIVLGSVSMIAPARRMRWIKIRTSLWHRFNLSDGFIDERLVGDAIGAHIKRARGRHDSRLRLGSTRHLRLHFLGLVLEIYPHQLRPNLRQEPNDRCCSDQISDGISNRNIIEQTGLLFRRNRQAVDRIPRRADHSGLGKCPGQQARCRPDIVVQELSG